MGGRISGMSPREENAMLEDGRADAVRPYQSEDAGDTATAAAVRQATRQQLIVCWPLGQQEFSLASDWAAAAVWQSVDIRGDAAKATSELCRPMTSIAIKAMSRRFMGPKIVPAPHRCKLSEYGDLSSYSVSATCCTEWTAIVEPATIRRMGRYTFPAYVRASTPRYVVVWDLQWQVLECQRLEPEADLSGAMVSAIQQLAGDGWQAESEPNYGFVFIRRKTERRLLMLTPRNPYDAAQSFSPFGAA
jgi:hypothetical protein